MAKCMKVYTLFLWYYTFFYTVGLLKVCKCKICRPCVHGLCATFIPFKRAKRFVLFSPPDCGSFFCRMALDGIRMPDGCYADGTWELKMHVTDLHRDVSLRVTGEIHIGGVMLKLVEKLGTWAGLSQGRSWRLVKASCQMCIKPASVKSEVTNFDPLEQ